MKLTLSEIAFNCAILLPLHREPTGYLDGSELISAIQRSKWLSADLLASVPSRSDARIANRIHNIVSHRDSPKNLIRNRLIAWHADSSGFTILEKGRKFLANVAQKLESDATTDLSCIDEWLKSQRLK
jgi:hypothetical protein